jgi:hypothetical protein
MVHCELAENGQGVFNYDHRFVMEASGEGQSTNGLSRIEDQSDHSLENVPIYCLNSTSKYISDESKKGEQAAGSKVNLSSAFNPSSSGSSSNYISMFEQELALYKWPKMVDHLVEDKNSTKRKFDGVANGSSI